MEQQLICICVTSMRVVSAIQKNLFIFVDLLSKMQIWLMQNFSFSKKSEISVFGTFISDTFILARKCPIVMVDPALDSPDSEVFNAVFDVITTCFPADLSRFIRQYPLLVGLT